MNRWMMVWLWLMGVGILQGEVRVDVQKDPLVITLRGSYQGFQHFALAQPPRFVVDLMGATLTSRKEIPVGVHGVVRVRVAQHRVEPRPVVRVVLDLEGGQAFRVEEAEGVVRIVPAQAPLREGAVAARAVPGAPKPTPEASSRGASTPSASDTVDTLAQIEQEILALRNPPPVRIVRLGRDPFEPPDVEGDSLLVPQQAVLVGVVENDAGERFALLTDGERNFILREGDRVVQGRVARVGKDFVVFAIYEYWIARTYRVKLSREEDRK